VQENRAEVKGLKVSGGATINWSKLSQESLKGPDPEPVTNQSNRSSRKVLRKLQNPFYDNATWQKASNKKNKPKK